MATWSDFKSFFADDEQTYIQAFIDQISSAESISYFSQLYPIPEATIAEVIAVGSAFTSDLSDYIFSKTSLVTLSGNDATDWTNFKTQFAGDYQPAIQDLINVLKAAPNSWTFQTFQGKSSADLTSVVESQPASWVFFTDFATALRNRVKQATDCWNVMESYLSGTELTNYREIFSFFSVLPDYDYFDDFLKTSLDKFTKDLQNFLLNYQNPRDFINFLIDDFFEKYNEVLSDTDNNSNKTDPELVSVLLSKYTRSDYKAAIKSLYSIIESKGFIQSFSDLSNVPAKTGATDTTRQQTSTLGFQLQPNPDFLESTDGWYTDTNNHLIASGQLQNNALLLQATGNYTVAYTSPVLTPGKEYHLEYTVIQCSDASNILEVADGTNVLETVTNPATGVRTLEFTAATSQIEFHQTAGTGYFNLSHIYIYEKLTQALDAVVTTQQASDTLSQIVNIFPYTEGPASDPFVVMLNSSFSDSLVIAGTGAYSTDLTAVYNAIDQAIQAGDSWAGYTASTDTDHIVLTGPASTFFTVEFVSLKTLILGLSSSSTFWLNLANDIFALGKKAIQQNSTVYYIYYQLIQDPNNTNTLPVLTVEVFDMDHGAGVSLGKKTTDTIGRGMFEIRIVNPSRGIRDFEFHFYDGVEVMGSGTLVTWVLDDPTVHTLQVNYYPDTTTITNSISITDLATQLSITISSTLSTFLNTNNILTLEDIRNVGGLKNYPGIPSGNDATIALLDSHASLDAVSTNHTANNALISAGINSVQSLAMATRSNAVQTQEQAQMGSFNAASAYYVAKSYARFLQNIITGHLASNANNYAPGSITQLNEIFTPGCTCKDCDSAVSPLAYLTDLLNYVLAYVENGTSTIDTSFLESNFYQRFSQLPNSCSASEVVVCQQRLATEVMRNYIATLTLSSTPAATLASDTTDYCFAAYKQALTELGTNFDQVRSMKGKTQAEQQSLADSLSLPFSADTSTDPFDPFSSQNLFIDPASSRLSEQTLEELFGLQDTTRDPLSTGTKFNDTASQLTRWIFKGVAFGKNVDSDGYLYLTIDSASLTVKVYNDSGRTLQVGTASESTTPGILTLVPDNNSDLTGELYLTDFTDNSTLYVSVIPRVQCWRLQKQRTNWFSLDWPENLYTAQNSAGVQQLPVIDPDIISPTDFRVPDQSSNTGFKIWVSRRTWVDDTLNQFLGLKPSNPEIRVQSMLDLMTQSFSYTHQDNSVSSLTPWSAAPNLNTLYTGFTTGDAQTLTDIAALNLSNAGFARLYEVYRKNQVNDEKGLIVKLQTAAATNTQQVTYLIPETVNDGDQFQITVSSGSTTLGTVSLYARGTDIPTFLGNLKAAIDAENWALTTLLSSNSDYLIVQANAVDTSFAFQTITFRVADDTELEDAASILTQAVKLTYASDWISEESTESVSLNSTDFWQPVSKPKEGEWPITSLSRPYIDPDILARTDIPLGTTGDAARSLYDTRQTDLDSTFQNVKQTRETSGLEAAFEYAWGTGYLALDPSYTYTSLDDLNVKLNSTDITTASAALDYIETKLYLTTDDFKIVRDTYAKNSSTSSSDLSDDEWNTLYAILTKSYKLKNDYASGSFAFLLADL